jgi:tetratricopeptide (TPR) repeat protein
MADLSDGLARDPDNIAGLMARAQIRQSKGETAAAIADYDSILKRDQKNLTALNARATALMQTKSYAKAADDLDRVIQIDPKNAQAYYQRGLARERDNKFSDAVADYKKAIERDRNMGDARKALARAEAGERRHKPSGVVEVKKPDAVIADAPLPPAAPRKEAAMPKPELKPEVKTPEAVKQASLPKEAVPPPAKPVTAALPEMPPDRHADKPHNKRANDRKPATVRGAKNSAPHRASREERVAAPRVHRGETSFNDIWNERDGFKR